jgi:hypothetical protein
VAFGLFIRGEPVALGRVAASDLPIARASLADMAGLAPRDAGIAAGLADRTNFAARGGRRVDGTSASERSEQLVVCVSWGEEGRLGGSRRTGQSLGARGGGQREESDK